MPAEAFDNTAQLLRRIQLQRQTPEAVTQRTGHLTGTRSRADERKFRQVDTESTRAEGPLADDDIRVHSLHRGIENLLYRTVETMDLVNKQNIIL